MTKRFAFDLDGTVTTVETLPILARELGLSTEMKRLTDLTLVGEIPFEQSFRLRYGMLKNIPLECIQEIMSTIPLEPTIEKFIRGHREQCALVTGNLDCWIAPISAKLGCEIFSSTIKSDGRLNVPDKSSAIKKLRAEGGRVIAIGESVNDLPMLRAADVSIAYGGVHRPIDAAIEVSDFVVFDGMTLCRLLKTL